MKYVNAAEILPERLLKELQTYIDGEIVYIPRSSAKRQWGTASGSRTFYRERNKEIQRLYKEGASIHTLMKQFSLAYSTIKKIIYG
ncbi:MAG TPA: hypothetical protein H9717_00205 [Candidatus Eisenbergiella merdipullorum]|uniref:Mor transcription activator domain-containing protein n=1 Tax=Candidatus Eisenbergiella merdipullorum TaxID=2838553 RepID=A0A9D2KYG4_9FIRM|nr:hypothetical protein [Candidatus Eisenbergiella merdipullorum]